MLHAVLGAGGFVWNGKIRNAGREGFDPKWKIGASEKQKKARPGILVTKPFIFGREGIFFMITDITRQQVSLSDFSGKPLKGWKTQGSRWCQNQE